MNKKNKITAMCKRNLSGKLFAIASNENTDRMGDSILLNGWQLGNFKKNPVLLFAHKYNEAPIGVVRNLKIEDKNLTFEPEFHQITELAREVGKMYDSGIMNAFSVGFIPLKFNDKDKKIIEKSELLEISAVPVPAHAEALVVRALEVDARMEYQKEKKRKLIISALNKMLKRI